VLSKDLYTHPDTRYALPLNLRMCVCVCGVGGEGLFKNTVIYEKWNRLRSWGRVVFKNIFLVSSVH